MKPSDEQIEAARGISHVCTVTLGNKRGYDFFIPYHCYDAVLRHHECGSKWPLRVLVNTSLGLTTGVPSNLRPLELYEQEIKNESKVVKFQSVVGIVLMEPEAIKKVYIYEEWC